jgi:hypothetical protein
MKRILSDAALVCAFAMLFGAVPAVPQVTTLRVNRTEAASWREDLRFMAREMERRHRNLYHSVSRSSFESAVKALHERIPSLARHQIIVELAPVTAGKVISGRLTAFPAAFPD